MDPNPKECIKNTEGPQCHFKGTQLSCACPTNNDLPEGGKCVRKQGPTGSSACYLEETLDKDYKGKKIHCSCTKVEEEIPKPLKEEPKKEEPKKEEPKKEEPKKEEPKKEEPKK